MRAPRIPAGRRGQRGGVAVETAIILPLLLLSLAVPLFFARVFWCYSVAQKAAHDGARFLAGASRVEMQTLGGSNNGAPIADLTRQIVLAETAETRLLVDAWLIDVQCDLSLCGWEVPQTVRVVVRIRLRDHLFAPITGDYYYTPDDDGLVLAADVTMKYVGR